MRLFFFIDHELNNIFTYIKCDKMYGHEVLKFQNLVFEWRYVYSWTVYKVVMYRIHPQIMRANWKKNLKIMKSISILFE